MNKLPHKTHPCVNCPFKKDTLKGWLGEVRAKEITEASSFTCHKTKKKLQCAGHMLLMDLENEYVALANKLHIPLGLSGKELVFETKEQFINYHKNC